MTDAERIAAFLAAKGVTKVEQGVAYGVDAEADKAKRTVERARKNVTRYEETDVDHDSRMEQAHDAFFTGDREEGYRLLSERRYTRVKLNRY